MVGADLDTLGGSFRRSVSRVGPVAIPSGSDDLCPLRSSPSSPLLQKQNSFTLIQRAYDVLGNDSKRKQYDATGRMEKTVDEEFMDSFGGGAFRDKARQQREDRESMAEQLTVRQTEEFQSHTSGFEAWMRSRGDSVKTFTADNAAEQFGVVKSSYETVPLPSIRAYQARVKQVGKPAKESLELVCEPIPQALEWGEVLVSVRAAPVNPADLFDVKTGGNVGGDPLKTPFIGGNDGVGVIVKVSFLPFPSFPTPPGKL